MTTLTPDDIKTAKARGFLRNRGTDLFSGRIVSPGGVYTPEQLEAIANCARIFGNGKIAFTTRLSAEIVGIPFEKIDDAVAYIEQHGSGIGFGGTGARVRPITACKGTTCVFGCCDTQMIAAELHERYYLGSMGENLPHKFKIAVGGCPNSCVKPSLNDVGIEARRQKGGDALFQLFFGGTWGRTTRNGSPFSRLVAREELEGIIDETLTWFRENGNQKERLGAAIDRLGMDSLEAALKG